MVATYWMLDAGDWTPAVERPEEESKSLQKQDKQGQQPKADPVSS